jgi:aryl-alcohol dehydrogenase-like predicted oxidoreductase
VPPVRHGLTALDRHHIARAVEGSLKRLGTDYIDLYWVHAFDYMTPVDEIMRGLDDLVRAGKVLYVGISDTPAWIVSQANTMAELRGWSRFVGLQIEYSLIERTVEHELLPMARAFGLAVTPWGIIGGGVLTGKYADRKAVAAATHRYADPSTTARINERNLAIGDTVVRIAKEMGCSPANVATNWIRQQPGQFIPILGVRSVAQLKENMACLDHPLSQAHLDELHKISAVDLGFPHKFVHLENIRELLYAGTYDRIDRD